MLDELRRDIERRLNDLLSEADKLRHALEALGPDGHAASSRAHGQSSAPRARRATSARRAPARAPAGSTSVTPAASQPATSGRARARGTKDAVLAALSSGDAMTASDLANATGLGRASVSTTLSKLAQTGEITKAARGYQLADQRTPAATAVPEQAPDGDGDGGGRSRQARPATPTPRARRQAPNEAAVAAPKATAERPQRRGREELSPDRLEAMLADSGEGLSAVAIAGKLSASPSRVISVLRELEAAGRVRREGSRRTSRWRVVSDEERIAERAAQLAAQSRQQTEQP